MTHRKHTIFTFKHIALTVLSLGIISAGIIVLWLSTIQLPDFKSFEDRKVASSTKIYDRTGQVLLYDLHQDIKRSAISFAEMGSYIKNATVAIEDSEFYQHSGIRFSSIIRAVFADILHGKFSQGGSTITQQIVKNTLLTKEKTITRKLKEWILAIKIDKDMGKEDILATYLNEAPYGGSIYGIEEASETYFGKKAFDLTLAEASYLAAIPQAPTFYSPYGKNRDKLDARKNLVLSRMHDLHFITDEEYAAAQKEQVTFQPEETTGIKAPHFVFFIKDYLEQKYGQDVVEQGGLKVITTLNYDLQQKAEEIVKRNALENEKKVQASNAGLVAIDPATGQILVMVGSRDYFDKNIDGNYNIATAKRQPGSAFKPFVYATAFNRGYTPETVLFDVPTEFNPGCSPYGKALPGVSQSSCYMPVNYGGSSNGPLTIRSALARSINIPAVKTLYLVGIDNALKTAKDMGITTLGTSDVYGLALVLGGGEVRLLDMTSAYGVFATEGVRHPYQGVLEVDDLNGTVLEKYQDDPETVLPKNTALKISSILSDNVARSPTFGSNSTLYFPNRTVAVKTGTTNDFKDAWVVGYTPTLVAGAWVGNNDNTPMAPQASASISVPLWHEFMNMALKDTPNQEFNKPDDGNSDITALKPVLRGVWQGGNTFTIDSISKKLATELTPKETREEKVITDVHSILYWVDKNDVLGNKPENPANNPQFKNWETAVQDWWIKNSYKYTIITPDQIPIETDDIHTETTKPVITILSPSIDTHYAGKGLITITISQQSTYPLKRFDVFINNTFVGSSTNTTYSFNPDTVSGISDYNELRVVAYDIYYNSNQAVTNFYIDS